MRFIFVLAALLVALLPLVGAADFFYNDVTGTAQWEEPDHPVAYEDDEGRKYWFDKSTDESVWEYPGKWSEVHSEEHGQPYYFNKDTKESSWEQPEEMAWRRVVNKDIPRLLIAATLQDQRHNQVGRACERSVPDKRRKIQGQVERVQRASSDTAVQQCYDP
eukprot:383186-Prorocentrum_minimum.AAC.4